MTTTHLSIEGMHCASCAVAIEKELGKVDGVKKASVNFALKTAAVEHDQPDTAPLMAAVEQAGYTARQTDGDYDMHDHMQHGDANIWYRRMLAGIVLSAPLLLFMVLGWTENPLTDTLMPYMGLAALVLATFAQAYLGR